MSDSQGQCLVFRGFDSRLKKPILTLERFRLPASAEELKVGDFSLSLQSSLGFADVGAMKKIGESKIAYLNSGA